MLMGWVVNTVKKKLEKSLDAKCKMARFTLDTPS